MKAHPISSLRQPCLFLTGVVSPAERPKVGKFTIEIEHLADGLSLRSAPTDVLGKL